MFKFQIVHTLGGIAVKLSRDHCVDVRHTVMLMLFIGKRRCKLAIPRELDFNYCMYLLLPFSEGASLVKRLS